MSFSHRAALGAALFGGAILPAFTRGGEAPSPSANQELLDKVAKLESKVQKLEAEKREPAPDVQSKVAQLEAMVQQLQSERLEVQATKASVREDAGKQDILNLDTIRTTFTDGGLSFGTSDGRFRLHPLLHFVFRNVTNYRENATGPFTSSQTENGFEVRRMEFGAEGNAFTKDLSYLFLWDTDRHNGRPILELAFAQYHFTDTPWTVKAGQIKDPFDKEQLGSSAAFVAVERSLVVDTLAGGDAFTHAVSAIYDNNGPLRAETAFTDGFASANQTFEDYPVNLADWGASVRLEYKIFGDWSQYNEFSARGNKKNLLVIGGGLDYTEAGSTATFRHVVDAVFKTGQLGLYGAYLGRYTRHNGFETTGVGNTYDWSFRAQASYAIDPHWEPFARYSFMKLDSKTLGENSHKGVHEITAGVNYYIYGQGAKFTVDVDYLPNGSPINDDGTGVLSNGGGTELLVRANFQLAL